MTDNRFDQIVDEAHQVALAEPDPMAYLRRQQAVAWEAYFLTGSRYRLAIYEAFSRSLEGQP